MVPPVAYPPLAPDCFSGVGGLLPVMDAVARIARGVAPVTGVEEVALTAALDRVLAADLAAPHALPPFDQSAMDGYALASRDVAVFPLDAIIRLPIAGRTAAGDAAVPLAAGTACRIFTGAPLPPGADMVIPQEDVTVAVTDGAAFLLIPAERRRQLSPGRHCRRAGEDVPAGHIVMRAGTRLGPVALGLAGALGCATVTVRRPLRVVLLSTGNEVRPAGTVLVPGTIHDANAPLLTALLTRLSCTIVESAIVPDDPASLAAALRAAAAHADLIVTSGGASVGEEDHLRAVVNRLGCMDFWKLALKPGKPVGLGVVQGRPLLALPGNPMAAVAAFLVVGRALVQRLSGAALTEPVRVRAPAAFTLTHTPGKRAYLRVRLIDGTAHLCQPQGSAALSSLLAADGLLELPEEGQIVAMGDAVTVLPLAGWM